MDSLTPPPPPQSSWKASTSRSMNRVYRERVKRGGEKELHGRRLRGEGGVLRKSGGEGGLLEVACFRTAAACFPSAFSRTACMGRNARATACRALLCSESW